MNVALIPAAAGIYEGVRATSFPDVREDLIRAGDKERKIEALIKKAERFVSRHEGTRVLGVTTRLLVLATGVHLNEHGLNMVDLAGS